MEWEFPLQTCGHLEWEFPLQTYGPNAGTLIGVVENGVLPAKSIFFKCAFGVGIPTPNAISKMLSYDFGHLQRKAPSPIGVAGIEVFAKINAIG